MSKKPETLDDYKQWLRGEHNIRDLVRVENHYSSVANSIKASLEGCEFWDSLIDQLNEVDGLYRQRTGYELFLGGEPPDLIIKPFESFLLKTFKKNVGSNRAWPEPPEHGWVLPPEWFSRISDVVRTMLVVKYLDGVEFVLEELEKFCEGKGLRARRLLEAREEGYYAGHFYFWQVYDIPQMDWDTTKAEVAVELQVTTQLQEVIRRLLHKYYEEKRREGKAAERVWQWDHSSDGFITGYLGHILHFAEGLIVEVRDRQREDLA